MKPTLIACKLLKTFRQADSLCSALLTALLLAPLAAMHAADQSTTAGDRNLAVNQIYPPEAFYHNGKGGRVLDVTKPPFNAKGDRKTDDTEVLSAAMRFIRENTEIPKGDCNPSLKQSWTIYLPNGVYLVSDTVSQGWPAQGFMVVNNAWRNVERFAVDSPDDPSVRYEDNWNIRMVGQNRDKTIIRLRDESLGFDNGDGKAVVQFYMLRCGSLTNQGNYFENITIDTGRGNPGAVGLKWNGANWGGVRNARLRSGDGQGRAGLMMDAPCAAGYHRDLLIEGFDVGVELRTGRTSIAVLEYVTLSGQQQAAIQIPDGRGGRYSPRPISARKVLVRDAPVACKIGNSGHLVLLDSELRSSLEQPVGIEVEEHGHLFARDVDVSGYEVAVARQSGLLHKGGFIDEYVSGEPVSLQLDVPAKSMRLPVKDAPVCLPEKDLSQWASVDDFGAVGDGIHDDTAAIQKAVNSGKPVVWFPKATYVVNGTVDIPATVREMAFLWASVYRTESGTPDGPAMFRVAEPSTQPLFLHKNINAGSVFLDHEALRPVVFDDVIAWFHHGQWRAKIDGIRFPRGAQGGGIWRSYRNTGPKGELKEVFASSVLNFAVGGTDAEYAVEDVRAWIRMVNNEHIPGAQVAFRRSDVWILGFKIEAAEILFQVEDSSRLEVLGGNYLNFHEREGTPMIVSRDSQVSTVFAVHGGGKHHSTLLHDDMGNHTTTLGLDRFLQAGQGDNDAVIPLLVNRP